MKYFACIDSNEPKRFLGSFENYIEAINAARRYTETTGLKASEQLLIGTLEGENVMNILLTIKPRYEPEFPKVVYVNQPKGRFFTVAEKFLYAVVALNLVSLIINVLRIVR